jgi:hypothetical protein
MSNATGQNQRNADAIAREASKNGDAGGQDRLMQAKRSQNTPQNTPQQPSVSRFEKFAATQAAGDGIEGDVLKPGKTVEEKLAANMADRK